MNDAELILKLQQISRLLNEEQRFYCSNIINVAIERLQESSQISRDEFANYFSDIFKKK